MLTAALLTTALLFGGMVLCSFGFAAFLFSALLPDVAGPTIRRAFPLFYLFVAGTAALATVLVWPLDPLAAALLDTIAVTTLPTRQILMPAIKPRDRHWIASAVQCVARAFGGNHPDSYRAGWCCARSLCRDRRCVTRPLSDNAEDGWPDCVGSETGEDPAQS